MEIGMMEFLFGTAFGVAMTLVILLLLNMFSRRRVGRQAPPFRRRGGGPSGVREPRRPLVPAGSASAEVPIDALERIEQVRAIASERGHEVIIRTRRPRVRKTA
ncbi:MAG TPA: hypothetical protein VNA87_04705 [Actinomycetota bacterium]|nr:hypothetical protein [Actinomycetota bacterium]